MADDAGHTGDKSAADSSKGEKTYTQKELDDKIAAVRKGVESDIAKKFADYDDLKAKADQLDKLQESQKTDEQKTLERIEAAERRAQEAIDRADKAEVDALRARVAARRELTDVQAARLNGSTIEELEADAIELFGEAKEPDPPRSGPARQPKPALRGGSNPTEEPEVDVQKVFDSIEL